MLKSEPLIAQTRTVPSFRELIPETAAKPLESAEPSGFALLVSGFAGEGQRNRCANKLEEFAHLGLPADSSLAGDVRWEQIVPHYQMFILHQVQNSSILEDFIRQAKAAGKPVVFDADDSIESLHLESMHKDVVYRIGRTLEQCDAAIVSTERLRDSIQARFPGKPVYVHRNAASEKLCELAETVRGQYKKPETGLIRISFVSGKDNLSSVAETLRQLLDKYSNLRLLAVGDVDIPQPLKELHDRIEAVPAVPWYHLPVCYAMADMNLASEADPAAALMECPTASSIEQLELLVLDGELRARLGKDARTDVLERHTTRARSQQLKEIVQRIMAA